MTWITVILLLAVGLMNLYFYREERMRVHALLCVAFLIGAALFALAALSKEGL